MGGVQVQKNVQTRRNVSNPLYIRVNERKQVDMEPIWGWGVENTFPIWVKTLQFGRKVGTPIKTKTKKINTINFPFTSSQMYLLFPRLPFTC